MPTYNNLVPLHVDKDTGKMVASHRGAFALGGAKGYIHEQLVPTTTWNVIHNAGSIMMIPQVFDSTYSEIITDGLRVIDINTIEITFATPQSGFAHFIFFNIG